MLQFIHEGILVTTLHKFTLCSDEFIEVHSPCLFSVGYDNMILSPPPPIFQLLTNLDVQQQYSYCGIRLMNNICNIMY